MQEDRVEKRHTTPQARQLAWPLSERATPARFLIHDRDSNFSRTIDEVFRSEGASDGTHLGRLDHVRYERYADRPDEIVVRQRAVLTEATPRAVEAVSARERTIVLRLDRSAREHSRPV